VGRVLARAMAENLSQNIIVENVVGAGGSIGALKAINAAADGHTLLMSYAGSHAINAALYKKLPFDPEKDFEPVATLATLPFVLVVRPDSPVKSIKDLVEQGQRSPLTFGSAGNGSVNHLLGVMFNAAANTKLEHIPYRGAAPAMQDLMGGQINMVFTSLPSVSGAIKSGTLRPVAVTSAVRSGNFPNIPTIAEGGFKEFDVSPWFGLFAPAKTSAAVIRRINQDVQEVLKNKDVIERFNAQGADVLITQPAEFAGMLKKDLAKWSVVVKASGAQID
jgi:tripartite-type tricarboxylate transporter receptor subunit TctC